MGAASDAAWLALGAVAIAASIAIWGKFAAAPIRSTEGREHFRWTPEAVRLTVAYCAFGFGYIIPATFLPAMARELLADPLYYGFSWPVFGAAAAVSTIAAGSLRQRFGDRRVWIAGHVLMACGTVVLAIEAVPALWRTILCALLVGGSFVVVTMSAVQVARSLTKPENAPGFIAAITVAFATGQIVGPLVVTWTHDFEFPLLLAAGLLLLGAMLLKR
jgi:MFS family permease